MICDLWVRERSSSAPFWILFLYYFDMILSTGCFDGCVFNNSSRGLQISAMRRLRTRDEIDGWYIDHITISQSKFIPSRMDSLCNDINLFRIRFKHGGNDWQSIKVTSSSPPSSLLLLLFLVKLAVMVHLVTGLDQSAAASDKTSVIPVLSQCKISALK